MTQGQPPSAAVVVATHRRPHLLPRLVEALGTQTWPYPIEVVLVDDGSPDETWGVIQKLSSQAALRVRGVRLDHNKGPAAARNAGWRSTDARWVLFTDDDCVPQREWVAAMAASLERADIVAGRTCADPDQLPLHGPFSRTLEVPSQSGFYQTCNMGYRREVLETLDGFNEQFRHPAGEDTDLAWRALERDFRPAFAEDAVVLHDVRPSRFWVHFRDIWRWEGVVLAVRQHPGLRGQFHSRWFWRASHPPAIAGAVGAALCLAPGPPARRLLGAALLGRYVHFRVLRSPLRGTRRQQLTAIPLALIADTAEVVTLAIASVRYRTLLL